MTFLSAREDFVVRTLGALQGCWARLLYTAHLRDSRGRYAHWGFNRTHGEEKAQAAMLQAHRELFRDLLRQRIQDVAGQCGDDEIETALESGTRNLLPPGANRAAELHFTAVLFALEQLRIAKHPAA
jgi:hypothetical protein